MLNLLSSAVFGPLFLILLFAFCTILVIGAKVVFLCVKNYFAKPVPKEKPKPKRRKPRTIKPKSTIPNRSIEINPDEIDKIYVKKVS
ncbi:MAG: hypothetical protein IKW33_04070 [Clostridia bacterium]|nr:hypothetical protein [Clostridia bacterium]